MQPLEKLNQQILKCTQCPLWQSRQHAVPGEGNCKASIIFIGEAPGKQEDIEGRPFVGRAGKFLDEMIKSIGLTREDIYITNIVKCRPPENRDPKNFEIKACRPYLEQQIQLINPKIIVTLGRHALDWFFPDQQISKVHGQIFDFDSKYLIPTLHPAAAVRFQRWRKIIEEDFNIIKKILNKI
ncbi:MAG: uracil-DNA glycosylase [Calditrichaeota bacterium]|nr:MAG: uracil-DNA glycosylase [Calditrichota bacterium]